MRNDKPCDLFQSDEIFHEVGSTLVDKTVKGKAVNNATNYRSFKSNVEVKLREYDKAISVNPNTLAQLVPLWTKGKKCQEGETAYDMYSSGHPKIVDLIDDLKTKNGKGKTYRCPICEEHKIKHLDHYIPRSKYPEFALHPKNLIYLCEDCNEKKRAKWLDKKKKNRLIFNSYFDKVSGIDLLSCEINAGDGEYPYAEFKEKVFVKHTTESMRELSTIRELKIVSRYTEIANDYLTKRCDEFVENAKARKQLGESFPDIWSFQLDLLSKWKNGNNHTIVEKYLAEAIISSTIMRDWVDRHSTL